jgi:hypothetical protein
VHLKGRRRFKCRVRHYLDSGESHVEVKLKWSRGETVKLRAPSSHAHSVGDCADFLAACVLETCGLPMDHLIASVLEVKYRRITLVSRTFPERLTLDNGLNFVDVETKLARGLGLPTSDCERPVCIRRG